jgi:hypothetical protein
MKALILLLMSTTFALAGNSVTVTSTGNRQNVTITQSSGNHSANLNLVGNDVSVITTQSGSVSKSFSIDINCGSTCSTSPYTIDQY